MKRFTMPLLAATLAVAMAAPALATAAKTEVTGVETICDVVPGDSWVSDGILHARGDIFTTIVQSDDVLLDGVNTVVFNANINLATGDGTGHGTFSLALNAVNGTWEGSFTLKFSGGLFTGRAVGHGTGDLAGQQFKVQLSQFFADLTDPTLPCPPVSGLQDSVVGHVLDPHGA